MDISDPARVVIEHFPEGIVFLYEGRDEPRYTFVGGEGLEAIGLTKEGLEGHVVAEDRPPEIRDRLHDQYRRVLEGEAVSFEAEVEGRHFRLKLRPVTDNSGNVTAGFGVAQDITEQVVYREELERANERLERITDTVFHDVRNPLNVAQSRLELLREECDSDHVGPIASALDRIESLTNTDATALVEPETETLDAVDLGPVVRDAWRNVATGSATLRVDVQRGVRADPGDLRRMLENLFRNSVEHGFADGRPGTDDADRSGDGVTVTVGDIERGFFVADDGVGIPADEREGIFERGVTHSDGGTGLGLFIVRQVARTHGWEVDLVESESGGARFEICGVETVG